MRKNFLFLLVLSLGFFVFLFFLSVDAGENGVLPSSPKPSKTVEIILAGDVMLGRSVMIESLDKQKDPIYPFRKVGDFLNKADVVFVNLENSIIRDCPRITGGFKFCGLPDMVEGLIFSGINIVSLANNHSNNFKEEGLKETVEILNSKGIETVGLGNLLIKEIKGTKFGFLGFDYTLKDTLERDLELIRSSNNSVDILIVSAHWGEEYQAKAGKRQREIARKMIEAGADVVFGHHPHWVEDIEYIEGKPVYYSLGNFVFDQMWSEETKKGLLIKLTFKDGELLWEEKFPVYISLLGQPEFVK